MADVGFELFREGSVYVLAEEDTHALTVHIDADGTRGMAWGMDTVEFVSAAGDDLMFLFQPPVHRCLGELGVVPARSRESGVPGFDGIRIKIMGNNS